MQFRFDANQDFQVAAIESVARLFEGQPRIEADLHFGGGGTGFAAISNRLDIDEDTLLENLRTIQSDNDLPTDEKLEAIEAEIETADGRKTSRFLNFSVEMETGTGKTYVYVRTALELWQRYGLRKFIVVVPSVAIREGVLKTLAVTKQHLENLLGNPPYRYYVYDSASLSQIRQFALSDGIELMIMTIDAFNKAQNVINQQSDRLQGETPIHLVQAARPILILDEPQNMESEKSIAALAGLDPLLALRYSATHRNPYNVVYRLTPFEAYRQGLVKRIEVASVIEEDSENQPFVRLESIKAQKKTISARVSVHKLMKGGAVKEKAVTVKPGDSLEAKAERSEYADFVVEEINPGGGFIRFANGVELRDGESSGAEREAVFEAQVRYTIEEHFRKQERLRDAGVKVLSLFFIDRVDNYAGEDAPLRELFERAFNELKAGHAAWRSVEPATAQAAYFAQRRRREGNIELLDSVTGKSQVDEDAYNLIMKDKERLLSFDEPVSFVFSHSALREGWDNPNIFQICTLNQTVSEIKKRQEVGRGVRLAVDQTGERIHDEAVNVLTVIANESYERYVERLQAEIEEEFGKEGLPPKPPSARKRGVAKLRKRSVLKPEFKELWEKIKHRTRYSVRVDSGKLVTEVAEALDDLKVKPPRVAVSKAQVQVGDEDVFDALQVSSAKTAVDLTGRYPLPELTSMMADLMERTTPPVRLTRRTLLDIFIATKAKDEALENPHDFAVAAIRVLKDKLVDHLVDGIKYEQIGEWYEMSQLETEVESWMDYLTPSKHAIYDHVQCDSQIERDFVDALENKRDDVVVYFKLPRWFTIGTPVGEYNPDWAVVLEDRDEHGDATGLKLYLVRETKSSSDRSKLRADERRKVDCGEAHFEELGVDYKIATSAMELP